MKLKSRARLRAVKNRLPSCMLRLQAVVATAANQKQLPSAEGTKLCAHDMDGMSPIEVSEESAALLNALSC